MQQPTAKKGDDIFARFPGCHHQFGQCAYLSESPLSVLRPLECCKKHYRLVKKERHTDQHRFLQPPEWKLVNFKIATERANIQKEKAQSLSVVADNDFKIMHCFAWLSPAHTFFSSAHKGPPLLFLSIQLVHASPSPLYSRFFSKSQND